MGMGKNHGPLRAEVYRPLTVIRRGRALQTSHDTSLPHADPAYSEVERKEVHTML